MERSDRMRVKRILTIVLLFVAMGVFGAWWWMGKREIPQSKSRGQTTGTLGKYAMNSLAAASEFHRLVVEWLHQQGFMEITNSSFAAITGSSDWDKPGTLLRRMCDHSGTAYVFVPELADEKQIQLIGYHLTHNGTVEETRACETEFEKIESEFHTRFPSTWDLEKNGVPVK